MGLTLQIKKNGDAVKVGDVLVRLHPDAPVENIRLIFDGPRSTPIIVVRQRKPAKSTTGTATTEGDPCPSTSTASTTAKSPR